MLGVFLLAVLVATIVASIFHYVGERKGQKGQKEKFILGIYKVKGKWYYLKYAAFRLLLLMRKLNNMRLETKFGKTTNYESIEKPQTLSDHPKAFDAVFFVAANRNGFYMATGCEARKDGNANALCYLMVPGKGLLCSEALPSTNLKMDSEKFAEGEYQAGGVNFKMITPMSQWKIGYRGKMYLCDDKSQEFDVDFSGTWSSHLPHFDYEHDLHPATLARAIATEDWSAEYFENLKEAHQTHYEQLGQLQGKLTINNEETISINSHSFRDHSFGKKRDWTLMHRYGFHILFFKDGSKLVVAVICQPCTSSRLEAGYYCSPKGEIEAIEKVDLELYRHGEGGTPPTDYAFHYKAGGRTRLLQVKVIASSEHLVSETRMVERFVEVFSDGLQGWGVSEWNYKQKEFQ
ncbi:uncharacterized protein LOC132192778 [Neocloeon triangulifer]|uniref:uncharacterized protein LOC132192778 n=1 Tax=Neocloeon triangulifer TaxID=2078957 RepID=UPI00286F9C03|nr:uncharacterized protein LOC132192778 [Neocloeon triangulifer]